MVDGPVRRTLKRSFKPSFSSSGAVPTDDATSINEPRAEPIVDRSTESDDNQPVVQRNEPQRVGTVEVDPAELGEFIASRSGSGDGSSSGSGRRRRADAGQKRGTRKRKETPQNIEAVVTMVHTWASVILKTPELMLETSEVKALSESYSTFCEYHEVPVLTPKRMSEITLIATALSIYGTRFVAIAKRKRNERHIHQVSPLPNQSNVNHHTVM